MPDLLMKIGLTVAGAGFAILLTGVLITLWRDL